MKIARKFTIAGRDPFSSVDWVKRSSKITNPDGSVVFQMDDAEVPSTWSQLATDIMVSKYFRKAGVPLVAPEQDVLKGDPLRDSSGKVMTGPEKSAKQVIHRLAGCWRYWGETHGYFDSADDAQAFYDELAYMMTHQMCAPNSPQWFNTGLNFAYGITGPAQGHWIVNPETGEPELADDAYTHPQPHACFIQSVDDDLVNEGGIMDLWVREARLFKYGSGTGTNFSTLRGDGEKLSGGGRSSGLMSWLRIGDRAASAIKSGGTTRRAAKMVCLDMDHPDVLEFINWKVREEIKVQAMVEGMRLIKEKNKDIGGLADKLGLKLDYDFNGEAYQTVSGQNSNNSVRIPDEFFEALDAGQDWNTYFRTSKAVGKTKVAWSKPAKELWDAIGDAAWRCADPGVQYDSTINAWHTCPSAGRINASNPCSEYMFLDNTACNLASLNVLKFYDAKTRTFDVDRYEHGIDLWTIVLEISVLMAAFPSRTIAELSYKFRTLGLGYANLGAMLMQAGIAYDSEEGRAICACLSAILTGRSYRMSSLMAKELGAFPGYAADKANMLRVMKNHRAAARGADRSGNQYDSLKIRPVPIDHKLIKGGKVALANAEKILDRAVASWDQAVSFGEMHGYRNAQTTVIAPTGTIGLLMDCDTTGVEPDFALVKFKKLAGGGYFKIANESVRPALVAMGYSEQQVKDIMTYLLGALHLDVAIPGSTQTVRQFLLSKGLPEKDIKKIEDGLPGVFELSFAFAAWAVSPEGLKACGIDHAKAASEPSFNLLKALGISNAQFEQLSIAICGTSTIEGAPHLKAEHVPVFDCANKCGKLGKRYIAPEGHIRMMAAAQPFISGAISKTINLPNDASVQDIKDCYRLSWELGLKANALYRDGCKQSQPLSATADEAKKEVGKEEATAKPAETAKVVPVAAVEAKPIERVEAPVKTVDRPKRRRLPDTRRSVTHKFNVAGHEGYLTVGLFEDGQPGELFITMSKEGSTIGGLMDSLGTATSISLQYGVPVASLVSKFSHQRFEPAGMTENREIPIAKSLVDYIFRWMGMEFVAGYREANAPQRPTSESPKVEAAAGRITHSSQTTTTSPSQVGGLSNEIAPGLLNEAPSRNARESEIAQGISKDLPPGAVMHIHKELTDIDIVQMSKKAQASTLSKVMGEISDAPACDVCGNITVRSGTCHKCVNCGNSMGCS
ncbi:MAG: adenosylcobalamin-dependent ribonucleoside-diphosphate reductase [Phycisphaerales bacterium]